MLLQQQGSRVEVVRPQVFSGKMKEVSVFINIVYLYIRIKIMDKAATTQMAWVLLYVQEGVAEAWKDNLLDELAKRELEVETAEQQFTKIRNDFGKMLEEKRKIEQLRIIEQREEPAMSTCRNSKRLPGGVAMRKDLSLKSSKED